jgi:glutamate 5-kinase
MIHMRGDHEKSRHGYALILGRERAALFRFAGETPQQVLKHAGEVERAHACRKNGLSRTLRSAKMARQMASPLATAKRIVLKIGSALLVDPASGEPARAWLDALADDVATVRANGQQVLIVSSGAIALGRRVLGLAQSKRLEEKQAAAAAGQARLMAAYEAAFARHRIPVAQALLTPDDTERRRRWLNGRATLETLLKLGAVPIVNENDTVATAEIRYGDNDRLAARAAQMISADALILFSDIDGLYEADPRRSPDAAFIAEVRDITPEIENMAGDAGALGSGGMRTKTEAAKIATRAGCAVAITKGGALQPLTALANGARATWFLPTATPRAAYKNWIAGTLKPQGELTVDDGALAALRSGKSLLAAGVTAVSGAFEKGDAVRIVSANGAEAARGLARYDAAEAARIKGLKTGDIAAVLGYDAGAVLVHADDLVLS